MSSERAAIANEVVLITGASRTLGAQIARELAGHGAQVAVNYHQSQEMVEALCAQIREDGGQAIPIQADVNRLEEVEGLVRETRRQLGPIDILVNNFGPYVDDPFLELKLADFDRIMAGNVRTTFLMCQLVGRQMKRRGSGVIVNVGATDMFHRSHSVYGLAKHGVSYLTEALALELAPEVRINSVAPDLIADNEDMDEDLVSSSVGGTPMGHLVTRREVAAMVRLLCGPDFASVTGQTIVMDGGRSIPRINMA